MRTSLGLFLVGMTALRHALELTIYLRQGRISVVLRRPTYVVPTASTSGAHVIITCLLYPHRRQAWHMPRCLLPERTYT
jgi:hypothetical protein